MPYVEDFQEFVQRMGTKPVQVGARFVFINGANSDGHLDHREPSNIPAELTHWKHLYSKARLDQLRKEYESTRSNVAIQIQWFHTGAGPMPEPGWREYLKKLRQEIDQLAEIVERLATGLPRYQRADVMGEAEERRAQIAQEELAALNAIED
ncbi:MAG: hypothetical protein JW395_1527 [Nitrospira sp.]|jgi:hypothetical protein|nr:hypothetical protein [Nitrospira sp.]